MDILLKFQKCFVQDREQDRAEGPNGDGAHRTVLSRSESLNSISSKGSQDALEPSDCKLSSEDNKQQPYMVRTRSDSGRPLTDQVQILNTYYSFIIWPHIYNKLK